MRKKIVAALITIIITSLVCIDLTKSLETDSKTILSTGQIVQKSTSLLRGVNYMTTHMEAVTNDILERDFARFEKDGINVIGVSLYWYRLEGNQKGDYNGTYTNGLTYGDVFLEDVKRFIQAANKYNINVIVSFHTLWQETGNEWCTPDYVVNNEGHNTHRAILVNESMKQAFLDMVNHTVSYLKQENIFAWGLLNEPWGEQDVESFIDLIQRESTVVKEITGSPVTVRFVCMHTWIKSNGTPAGLNHFSQVFKWDERIFNSLDFISLNSYIQYPELYDVWQNITQENVKRIIQEGKEVLITEFGFKSDNDTLQSQYYEKTIKVFNELPITGFLAWNWNHFELSNLGKGYNILKDMEGNPRQAYYEIIDKT